MTTSSTTVHIPSFRPTLLASACFILGCSSSSFAQYQATAYVPNGTLIGQTNTPGDVIYAYNSGAGATAVVAFKSSPVASVSFASTVVNPIGNTVLSGGGVMTYRFSVVAQPFTNVPIDFLGFYSSFQGSAGQQAATSFTIQTINSSVSTYSTFQSYFFGNCSAPTCLQYTTFNNTTFTSSRPDIFNVNGSFQGTLGMLTGADGTVSGSVQLFAGANTSVNAGSASSAAFIDPQLKVNATFLAANPGATLNITSGVGNTTLAVPEPGTYALFLAGLASIAVVGCRRSLAPSKTPAAT